MELEPRAIKSNVTAPTLSEEVRDRDLTVAGLLAEIGKARLHPDLYPPHGNSTGAVMDSCLIPLVPSGVLSKIATEHLVYVVKQGDKWIDLGNAHLNPDGHYTTEQGEPMWNAGYHAYRAEIFAAGLPSVEDTVKYWMQDDAAYQWKHRNIILNCLPGQEVGASVIRTGTGYGNYYLVDFGKR